MKMRANSFWLVVVLAGIGLLSACQSSDKSATEPSIVSSTELSKSDQPAEIIDEFRLGTDVAPIAQQLTLEIDPGLERYSGSTTITLSVHRDTTSFRLHAKDMQINSLSVTRADSAVEVSHRLAEHGLIEVESAAGFGAGQYKLAIEFDNDFNTDGVGINRTEQDGRHYIFSQFEATDARQAFPCFDEPAYKFPWQLTLSAPVEHLAITNTPVEMETVVGDVKTTVFAPTPPLSSYLIAVAVGPFEAVEIEGLSIPGRVIVPMGKTALAAAAVETTPPILTSLEDYFGEPYPFKKLDLIATNQAFSGAMEHPGAITYSDYLLLLDSSATAAQKGTLIKITAHELAHQWFGNLVTMQWWDDLWLNESFADWMGDRTVEEVYPEYGRDLQELRTIFRIMNNDARSTTKAIRHDFKSTDDFSDGIFLSYFKGKSVIGMFENAVGAETFRNGVVSYIRKYSRGNAAANDFWAALDSGADFDLAAGLASFIDQPGIPIVKVTPLGAGAFEFSQSRFSIQPNAGGDNQSWVIPIGYRYLVDGEVRTGNFILSEQSQRLQLGEEVTWVMPNAGQLGYYRWQVPADMLTAIGKDSTAHLNVRERMGVLTNLWALLAADEIKGDTLLEALSALSSDNDTSFLAALLDQLTNVRRTFITPELREPFARYVSTLLQPAMARIGTSPIPDESPSQASLRRRIIAWLADTANDEVIIAATDKLVADFLTDKIAASGLVDVALQSVAGRGNQEFFEQMQRRLEASVTPGERRRYLNTIGAFRKAEIVRQALKYTLAGDLKANDIRAVVGGLVNGQENMSIIINWMIENDEQLRERLPQGAMARMPDLLTRCSPDDLIKVVGFYGAPERAVPGIDNELRDAEAAVEDCWRLRQREMAAISDYLEDR